MSAKKVTNIEGQRLLIVLDALGYSQRELGAIIGVSGQAIGKSIKAPKLSKLIREMVLKHLPVHEEWLVDGTGPMLKEQVLTVQETVNEYKIRTGASKRYERFIREYAIAHGMELQEVAAKMNVDYNTLVKTINGHRELDCELLENAVLHLGCDANEIVAGIIYVPKALRECHQRIEDLEEIIRAQRETIDALKSSAAKKAA